MSDRQYLTDTEFKTITCEDQSIADTRKISEAEAWVDRYIAEFYTGGLAKAFQGYATYENVTCTTTSCTLPVTFNEGYLKFVILTPLNGTNAGKSIQILTNSGNTANFEAISGLSDTTVVKLEQLGKFPMQRDQYFLSSKCYKFISQEIKEAVAWQVKFINDNPNAFTVGNIQSESIADSYSYSKSSIQDSYNISQYLAPQTIQILEKFRIQTI